MDALYLWPGQPALSLFALWLASVVFLWAAREPMARLCSSTRQTLEGSYPWT